MILISNKILILLFTIISISISQISPIDKNNNPNNPSTIFNTYKNNKNNELLMLNKAINEAKSKNYNIKAFYHTSMWKTHALGIYLSKYLCNSLYNYLSNSIRNHSRAIINSRWSKKSISY
jgi:hypothetical protein